MTNVKEIIENKELSLSYQLPQNITVCGAPMAGITDKPFRQIMRHFTNAPLYTEMVGVASLYHNSSQTKKMIDVSDEKNIIVQLVGIEKEYMAFGTKQATDLGAVGIDINMGCPVKKLITNKSGASLMKYPDIACELVETVKKNTHLPVSVKTRIGWDERSVNILEFVKMLENAGADRIAIHGRTKAQGYAGLVHYDIIKQAQEKVGIPIIVNGDIVDEKSLAYAYQQTGLTSFMIGRGLLGKPWLLGVLTKQASQPNKITDIILEHLDLMLSYYGQHGLLVARKHLAWYAKGKKELASFCQNIYAQKEINTVQKMIKDYFD